MKSLKELENTDLKWQSKGWLKNARHELVNRDGEIVARVNHLSFWNNDVEVDAPGNRWTFARRGHFSGRHILIHSVGTGEQIATFYYRMAKPGLLEFTDGRTYTWKLGDFWGSKWVWLDKDEKPIVGFSQGGTFQLKSGVHLGAGAEDDRSAPLLIFLGWYLVLLQSQDSDG
jgi:hypothetical protein